MYYFLNDYKKLFLFLIFIVILLLCIFFFTFLAIILLPIFIILFLIKKYFIKNKPFYDVERENYYNFQKNKDSFIDAKYTKDDEKEL